MILKYYLQVEHPDMYTPLYHGDENVSWSYKPHACFENKVFILAFKHMTRNLSKA